ncbi:von Willebrand factor type A domain [Candidatus Kryptonium thompsonii]|nr:von Willebrand factor type A domain [Candidatus Kryptonium thompsoni]
MGIKDRLGDRKKYTKEIVDKLSQLKIHGEKKFFTFSSDVEEIKNFTSDSLSFAGGVTDIGGALRKIQGIATQENIKSIVLVSDGVYNAGENPIYIAEKLGLPIFTIGVGDSNIQRDLKVVDVLTNEVSYAGLRHRLLQGLKVLSLVGTRLWYHFTMRKVKLRGRS